MGQCKFIRPGILSTIQDSGRKGYGFYGVPQSGYMDREAAELAQLILGLPEGSAVIECTMIGPTIIFHDPTELVITGADMRWKLDEAPISLNKIIQVEENSTLSSRNAVLGFRSYIAINGTLRTKTNLGSASTYNYAQLGAKQIAQNDILRWTPRYHPQHEIKYKNRLSVSNLIKIQTGPEYHLLDDQSKKLLAHTEFIISPNSNRMGAKLSGTTLNCKAKLTDSVPVLPGFIQLPPNGNPIVILNDGQVTGGYPRIAYMNEVEQSKFNQLPIGHKVILSLRP